MVKQEPESYAWETFVGDGRATWTGVRNFQARNNLRAMKLGDLVFYYHSVSEKRVVGLARVAREHYPDPTAGEGDWSVVDLVPLQAFPRPVGLDQIKADPILREMALVRQSRLSVLPVTPGQAGRLLELGEVPLQPRRHGSDLGL